MDKRFVQYLDGRYGGQTSQLICIDGKTMKGTIPKGETQGVHLLSVYLAAEGIVLKQVEVGSKKNEIRAGKQLLENLNLKEKVVCADAMQTQRDFCVRVLSGGGDYLLFAKKNQPTLLADIQQFFLPPRQAVGWHIPQLPKTTACSVNKAHGRLEKRTVTVMADADGFVDWPGLKQVFRLERFTHKLSTGVEQTEVVYGLTSCPANHADATQILGWTRAYWQIENGLHHRRDATLNEDRTRISNTDLNNPKLDRANGLYLASPR